MENPVRCSRLALWVWYRGEGFRGFQKQTEGPTVQEALERALCAIGVNARPVAAGRTDKGVHARMQVVGVRLRELSPEALLERLRTHAVTGLGFSCARVASSSFHPQWSTAEKEYRYRIRLGSGPSRWGCCSWAASEDPRLGGRTDVDLLASLLARCVGTRDFSSFHEKSSPRRLRTISEARLVELGEGLFEVCLRGDRFGRYQVRYLVGSAVDASCGDLPPDKFCAALESGEEIRGVKAPAQGLILWEVRYPPHLDPFSPLDRRHPQLPFEPPFAAAGDF
jgi:tRNA pseudouridine38-40 synthase